MLKFIKSFFAKEASKPSEALALCRAYLDDATPPGKADLICVALRLARDRGEISGGLCNKTQREVIRSIKPNLFLFTYYLQNEWDPEKNPDASATSPHYRAYRAAWITNLINKLESEGN
jgi:hypothetical protein